MKDEKIKIYDIAEDREISLQEFWEDETPEDVEYYIDLKINLIIDEIKHKTSYQEIKDTLFDSEISFDEDFYNLLIQKSNDKEIYDLISQKVTSNEQDQSSNN